MSKTVLQAGVSVTVDAPAPPSSEAQAIGEKIGAQATEAMNDIDSLPEAPPEEPCIPCLIGAAVKGFLKGFVIGFATAFIAGLVVAAIAVTSPAWATAAAIGLAVVGVGLMAYQGYQLYQHWGEMTTEQKVESVSELVGGAVGGGRGSAAGFRTGGKVFGPPGSRAPGAGTPPGGGEPSPMTSGGAQSGGAQTISAPAKPSMARVKELGVNHEQGGKIDLAEGLGKARYEAATGRTVQNSNVQGADFIDPQTGPMSLKGPLVNKATGEPLKVSDQMVQGLSKSVVKDVKFNSATDTVVVDMQGMTPSQQATLKSNINSELGPNPPKKIIYME